MKKPLALFLMFLVLFSAFAFLRFGFAPTAKAEEPQQNLFFDAKPDWKVLWVLFNQYAMWDLEWYNSTSLVWISIKNDLTVQRAYPENDTCKITLVFDASKAGNYRLTFAVDARVRSYVNRTGEHQYELSYDDYSIVFDWSDVIAISGLQVTHGFTAVDGSDYFWFRMRRDNVPKGAYVVIDPTVIFSTVSVTSVHTCPLDTHTFVVVYSDDTNDDFSFQIWDTNGTQVLAETDVDTTSGGDLLCTSIGVSAFNSTTFVVGWHDKTDLDATFAIYNTAGSLLSGPTDADTSVSSGSFSVQVSCLNSTHFVIGWYDSDEYDTTFAVYEAGNATAKTGPIDADTNSGTYSYSVSVSAFNSTVFVVGWYDSAEGDATFAVYYSNGTQIGAAVDVDDAVSASYSVSVSALNSTHFVIGWFDRVDEDATFAVYTSAGALVTGPTDADTAAGTGCNSVQVSALNSTAFAMSWYDYVDYDLSFATYLSNGTAVAALTDIESWPTAANAPFTFQSPCSQESGTGIRLYGDNWVIAYANTTTKAIWKAFTPTGAAWDGTIPIPDVTKPTYSGVSTNSTVWATACNFSVTVNDETALHPNGQYVFGCNNTGAFTNETAINFTTTSQLVSITKTLNATNSNATQPEIVQFEWWFSDNVGNLNNTGLQTLTLSWQLSIGWNNATIFQFDVGYTLAGINASLNYDNLNWSYIVYQNSSTAAQYVFVKNMSANNLIRVYQTTGILLIFCNQAGNWTHTYPYQGGDYGEDPTPYIVAAVSLGIVGLAVVAYKKLKKKKVK